MPKHDDQQHFNYTTLQLFTLVSDVERYPEFLPWVKAVRIVSREADAFVADVVVSFKHITEQYRCRVSLKEPASADEAGEVNVSLVSGPFRHLVNHWRFEPESGGCKVAFHVDFAFKSKLLDGLIGTLFDRATMKMINAFSARAEALYGAGAGAKTTAQ